MSDWRLIETAPMDGTRILALDINAFCLDARDGLCCGIATVWWDDDDGEWRDHGDMGANGTAPFEPTHWMPLPAPPEESADE